LDTDTGWDQEAQGINFATTGANTLTLGGGLNYNGQIGVSTDGAIRRILSGLVDGYSLFENTDQYQADFLLMGSANYAKETAQALANKLISVAELRKDALAFISPNRLSFLTDTAAGSVTVNSDATSQIT
jgi:hypothetical protein